MTGRAARTAHHLNAVRAPGAAAGHPLPCRGYVAIAAAAVLSACVGPEAHDDAAALRADSSAAGYDVAAVASGGPEGADASGPRTSAPPAGGEQAAARPGSGPARTDASAVPQPAAGQPATPVPPSTDPARPVTTVEPTPGDTPRTAVIARIRVNEYLEYEPVSRTAYIDIVATRVATVDSTTISADTLSFNGGRAGSHSVTVPLGWRIVGQFVNRDPVHPHSAIVIEEAYPLATVPPPAAFPQALTRAVEDGLATNVRDEMTFTAAREGRFLIVCGVPGHAEGGQHFRLVVTSDVNVPGYRR